MARLPDSPAAAVSDSGNSVTAQKLSGHSGPARAELILSVPGWSPELLCCCEARMFSAPSASPRDAVIIAANC